MLDVVLFAALVIASNPLWTGVSLHEWLSGLLIVPVLYHLAINWDWVARTAVRLTAKLKTISRLNLAVDVALFLASVTVMLSGFMVIPGVATADPASIVAEVWRQVHHTSSNLTILTMVLHLALHAKWMYQTALRTSVPRAGRHAIGQAAVARSRGAR